ncbi:MAG: translation initiation factor IF-2 N-terminal domain-containing protein, partial [Thermoguttaceae bacterium]|nr:translation initiation factor IF-2 N-terminal domain-containing protein [Thermoguttaceae bacterium]
MSIRIYALAKQLKKESKELVEICKKLGLDGKGSPLASLTDEETKVVVDYFEKTERAPAQPSSQSFLEETESAPMRKPPVLAPPTGKVPVLRPARTPRLPDLPRPKTEAVENVPVASQPEVAAPEEPKASVTPVEPVVASEEPKATETPVESVAAPEEPKATETPVESVVASEEPKATETPVEPVAVDANVSEETKKDEDVSETVKPVAKPV